MAKSKVKWDRQAGNDQAKAIREAGKKRYDGLTAREYRQKHSKFAKRDGNYRPGSFAVAALYFGHDKAQEMPCKDMADALSRFAAIIKNPNVLVVKLIEFTAIKGSNESKTMVHHQYHKTNQQFCNSKVEHIWRIPGSLTLLTDEGVKKQQVHTNNLELARTVYTGGQPWWESRH